MRKSKSNKRVDIYEKYKNYEKKIFLITITLLVQLNYSCTKNESLKNEEDNLKSSQSIDYDDLKERSGGLHNEFLDYVYNNTSYVDLHSDLTLTKINAVINLGVSFFSQNPLSGKDDYLDELQIIQDKKQLFLTDLPSAFDYTNDPLISDLSRDIINSVKTVLMTTTSAEDFNKAVNLIYQNNISAQNVTDQEKYYIATECGIAISSYAYWSANAMLWKENATKSPKGKLAELVLGDMTGAAWGSCCLPGVGTAFGAALASSMVAWSWD